MAYSKAKPYQRTSYKGAVDPSYDRFLKEAATLGKAENIKESELEKPYNVKQTYSAMQQDYDPLTPPTIDPGVGTGGLKCIWTSTGCEQLVGCWAGSDIVLTGPEAATAGYLPIVPVTGEIVKQTIGGSESRGIDIIMSPIPLRNTFTVRFKDGLGTIHEVPIDITCPHGVGWLTKIIFAAGNWILANSVRLYLDQSNGYLHSACIDSNTGEVKYSYFDGVGWTSETAFTAEDYVDICLDGSSNPFIVSTRSTGFPNRKIISVVKSGVTWTETDLLTGIVGAVIGAVFKDSSNYIHIIYENGTATQKIISHATNASGSWLSEDLVTFNKDAGWDGFSQGYSACIAPNDTIHLVYTQYYSITSPSSYSNIVRHKSGTYGSWSGATTLETRTSFLIEVTSACSSDNANNIYVIFDSSTSVRYYAYTGSWSGGEDITGSTVPAALLGVLKGASSVYYIDVDTTGNTLFEFNKTGSWAVTEFDATYGAGYGKIAYDYANNIIHVVCAQSTALNEFTGGVFHYYRYV
jgi:hypothetical protein